PLYDGALALAEAGERSSIYEANAAATPVFGIAGGLGALLHDPQTAGGLLAAVAADEADALVEQLQKAGHKAARIGQIIAGDADIHCV
ncbi:MAG: AIR synthase-related protein, partial [Maritimibacter sp.]